ncbi:FAD-dependent oxidoreductase [Arthrobacter sp. CG_A4]|uniref:FAD-dependent oxidoreductase n=1 Tax=Arthrobacter sp. CG_A4 TaxID=3071706 RepID=UPI002DFE062E|nr:2-polyprenyl-6-methoxyphenol hydroxylase-like FAD-dependent oxidoreductase [Arthrobacter sp. CG_A4]
MAEVLIIGGGPVGLFMAALLLQSGVSVRVLEQRTGGERHSRAIGIHPPALKALERIGVARELIGQGVPIRRGVAVGGGDLLAEMTFAGVSDSFPFVLSLPQTRTEAVLEQRVRELDSGAVHRGVRFTGMREDGGRVTVEGSSSAGPVRYSAALVIAADGVRSAVRTQQGSAVRAKDYPDRYLMGDFADSTSFGPDAALFLEPGGIVESFPLPGKLRRWVVRLDGSPPGGPADVGHAGGGPADGGHAGGGPADGGHAGAASGMDARWLTERVRERTGIYVEPGSNSMLSGFGARSRLVRHMVTGRTVLIGDAAHEVSPIGGQGMNLGWLDAVALAPLVCDWLQGAAVGAGLRAFERSRQRAAARAAGQSELNMALGRPLAGGPLRVRNRAIAAAAALPAVNAFAARRFTMQ